MITRLRGRIEAIGEGELILEVGGVGYLISCSAQSLRRLGGVGDLALLEIDLRLREEAIELYGFADSIERQWFRWLITVQGVGVKVAMALLSALSPAQLAQAIISQDRGSLTVADGVGPKLASRLLTELKERAFKWQSLGAVMGGQPGGELGQDQRRAPASSTTIADSPNNARPKEAVLEGPQRASDLLGDVVSALVNLGYKRGDAFMVVSGLLLQMEQNSAAGADVSANFQSLLKAALQRLTSL
jgi:holliday junction DNA helicase RuvA